MAATPRSRTSRWFQERPSPYPWEQDGLDHIKSRMPTGDPFRAWTWAGFRANATLAATLSTITDERQRFDDSGIRMRTDLSPEMWTAGVSDAAEHLCLPEVDERALAGLKFSDALPLRLSEATLAARIVDLESAALVLREGGRFVISPA